MAVNLHTTHFRFGIDELAESTHGWHAAEDVSPGQGVIANDATFLLRFTVQEAGGTAAANVDQQFQCRKNAGAWQNITTASSIVKAVAATALTNAGNCTKRLSGTGTFESTGAGQTEDGLSGGPPNDIAASGNSETECGLQIVGADVAGGDVLDFRLTSPDFAVTNDVVPSLTVQGATIVEADGSSAGAGAASADGRSVFAGVTAAAGVAASAMVGAALWLAVAAAAGLAADSVASGAIVQADAASAGIAVADGISPSPPVEADGASAGAASVSGVGAAPTVADGSAAGSSTVAVVGSAIITTVSLSAGSATATADGEDAAADGPTWPMPAETFVCFGRFR